MYDSFQVMFMSLYGYFSHVVWYFYPVSLVWELVIDTTFGLVNRVRPGTEWANFDSKYLLGRRGTAAARVGAAAMVSFMPIFGCTSELSLDAHTTRRDL